MSNMKHTPTASDSNPMDHQTTQDACRKNRRPPKEVPFLRWSDEENEEDTIYLYGKRLDLTKPEDDELLGKYLDDQFFYAFPDIR